MVKLREQQVIRLEEAGVHLNDDELNTYVASPDTLEEPSDQEVPLGYKRCGKCKQLKKFYLFNRNSSSRINCTGNCKECQSRTAQVSYDKNKDKRDYKKYYEENRELKREHGRKYYARHKDKILLKQKQYRQTDEGKEIMNKAHANRKRSMKEKRGIPYTREIIIDRDSVFIGQSSPLCCLCGKPIEDMSDIHMEHLISIAIGGFDCFTNVGCAHSECNLRKTKDANEITVEQVETLEKRAEEYIEAHPELFPEFA